MKKVLSAFLFVMVLSCSKDDNSNMSLKELGLEFNTPYKMQQQVRSSNNDLLWEFKDMPDSVTVTFVNDNTAIEAHGTKTPVTRNFVLHTRVVEGQEFGLDFLDSNVPCSANTCPVVISAAGGCTLYSRLGVVVLQKHSGANFLDGYKFVKK